MPRTWWRRSPNAGPYASGEFGFSVPLKTLHDGTLNGPTVFGGYGCPEDRDEIPAATDVFPSLAKPAAPLFSAAPGGA